MSHEIVHPAHELCDLCFDCGSQPLMVQEKLDGSSSFTWRVHCSKKGCPESTEKQSSALLATTEWNMKQRGLTGEGNGEPEGNPT